MRRSLLAVVSTIVAVAGMTVDAKPVKHPAKKSAVADRPTPVTPVAKIESVAITQFSRLAT